MHNLGSYLAAKAAQSRAPAQRTTPTPKPTLPIPHPAPKRLESLQIPASDAASFISTPATSSNIARGPLITSPTPTTTENSPTFSPMRGLWGADRNTGRQAASAGGGLLNDFEFEFEHPERGGGDWGQSLGESKNTGMDWSFGLGGKGTCQSTVVRPPPYEIAREGWLMVLMTLSWKRAYAIATYKERTIGVIHLYESDSDAHPFHVIDLSTCTKVEACRDANTLLTGRHEFKLVMTSLQDTILASESTTDQSHWVTALSMLLPRNDSIAMRESPMPVPSAPDYHQLQENEQNDYRRSPSPLRFEARSSLGTGFGNAYSKSSSPDRHAWRSGLGQDVHKEIVDMKELLLRLLDKSCEGAQLQEIRCELTQSAKRIGESAQDIIRVGEELRRSEVQQASTGMLPATNDLEAAIMELTDSMEMRTTKIAKMVHELLQKPDTERTSNASMEQIKTAIHEAIVLFNDKVDNLQVGSPQTLKHLGDMGNVAPNVESLCNSMQQLTANITEIRSRISDRGPQLNLLQNMERQVKATTETVSAFAACLEELRSNQHQHEEGLGMLMSMVAEGNQKARLRQEDAIKETKGVDGDLADMRLALEKQGNQMLDKLGTLHEMLKEGGGSNMQSEAIQASISELRIAIDAHGKKATTTQALLDTLTQISKAQENLLEIVGGNATQNAPKVSEMIRKMEQRMISDSNHFRDSFLGIDSALKTQRYNMVTKNDIIPIADSLQEIRGRISAIANRPPPSPIQTSVDRLDRPTTNMITSINDKLIHLSKLIDHIQETQTARFSAVEDRLQGRPVGLPSSAPDDETSTDKMLQQHKLTDIRNSLESIEDRLSRLGREGQTRHDVVDGRLDRVSDQLKHMQRTITKLVQVGMLGNGDAPPAVEPSRSVTPVEGGVTASLADHRSILSKVHQELSEIKEQLAEDVTGDRMKDLLGMFAISQDTHTQVADKVDKVLQQMPTTSAIAELQSQVSAISTTLRERPESGIGVKDMSDIQEIKTILSELTKHNLPIASKPSLTQSSSDTNATILRLTESIHSCLVSYLPTDLDTRLTSIQCALSNVSRPASPQREYTKPYGSDKQVLSAPRQAELRELLTFHQDLARREHSTSEALDSIQHSLARMLDCFDAHGLLGPSQKQRSAPATAASSVLDITEIKEIKDAVMEIRRGLASSGGALAQTVTREGLEVTQEELSQSLESTRQSLQQLELDRDALSGEVDALFNQRVMLLEQIKGLEAKRDASHEVNRPIPRRPRSRQNMVSRRISCPPGLDMVSI